MSATNQKNPEELVKGFLYDIFAVENRVGSELNKIVTNAGGVIELISNPDFLDLKNSFMNSTGRQVVDGQSPDSVISFVETKKSIMEKIEKNRAILSEEQVRKVNEALEKSEDRLNTSLSSKEGIANLVLRDLKREAVKNLTLLDTSKVPPRFLNTPEEREPIETFIAERVSFPEEMIGLLKKEDAQFAQVTLKNIMQAQIGKVFDPQGLDKSKSRLYKIDPEKLQDPATQKLLADNINKAMNAFVREGLSQKIIENIGSTIPSKKRTEIAQKITKLTDDAKIPLSILADPAFTKGVKARLESDVRLKGNPANLTVEAVGAIAVDVGLAQQKARPQKATQAVVEVPPEFTKYAPPAPPVEEFHAFTDKPHISAPHYNPFHESNFTQAEIEKLKAKDNNPKVTQNEVLNKENLGSAKPHIIRNEKGIPTVVLQEAKKLGKVSHTDLKQPSKSKGNPTIRERPHDVASRG